MSQRATGSAHCFPLRNANITAVAIFSSTHHRNSHIKTSRSRGIPLMTCTSNPLCDRVVREPQIPGGIWELLCLKFHNILSVREHEALVYYVQHLYNPICNIIACAKAGKQKHKAGRSLNTVHWSHIYLLLSGLSAECLKGIPHRKGRTSIRLRTTVSPWHQVTNISKHVRWHDEGCDDGAHTNQVCELWGWKILPQTAVPIVATEGCKSKIINFTSENVWIWSLWISGPQPFLRDNIFKSLRCCR